MGTYFKKIIVKVQEMHLKKKEITIHLRSHSTKHEGQSEQAGNENEDIRIRNVVHLFHLQATTYFDLFYVWETKPNYGQWDCDFNGQLWKNSQ